MKKVFKYLEGDKVIWGIVAALAIFSFIPVYSASSNLAYVNNDGNTIAYLLRHVKHLVLGLVILYAVHKVRFKYFSPLSLLLLPVIVLMLIYTLYNGTTIEGANASRWMKVPFIGISFQTSIIAGVVLMVYVARYLSRTSMTELNFKESILKLWIPVFIILGLILPANFSTTAIFFTMVFLLAFIGGYPIKYLSAIVGVGIVALTLFILTAKAFPGAFSNRVDTWVSRVENFAEKSEGDAGYQIEKAKIAIASGGLTGLGPGKSVQKNFLPQSSSDFIYAIIVEELGLITGLLIMLVYLVLLFRILIIAHKSRSVFGKLVVVGVGMPIVFMALINMAVAVELFPVTGQNLPLISSGGTSVWMTCLAVGIILSVSAKREEEPVEESEENPLDILNEEIHQVSAT